MMDATLGSGAFYVFNLTASNALSWVKPAVSACAAFKASGLHGQPAALGAVHAGYGVSACFLLECYHFIHEM
jgi:hypothetical protein